MRVNLFILYGIPLLLSGCIGSSLVEDPGEKNLREFPTLNSVPERPSSLIGSNHQDELQKMTKNQQEKMKANEELRKKYHLPLEEMCESKKF